MRNFRNFSNATFSFARGVNSLIGENGSGKSNILYAMRLLLDGNLPQRA
ncbi:AAA family ATPase, partial [Bacillus vallismortis]|nr:AAA family ATPase [Bacillus vallismortis]